MENSKTKTIELGKLGAILPLGVLSGENLEKTIDVKKWRMKEERELSKLKKENKHASMPQFVSMVLSAMANKIGAYDFTGDIKTANKMLNISSMYTPDVFYAYVWLRVKALGSDLVLNTSCPKCGDDENFSFSADLNTIDVKTVEKFEDAMWRYDLVEPFDIRGETVVGFNFGPPMWSVMEGMKGIDSGDTGAIKAALIHGSIQSIIKADGKEEAIALAQHELDDMCKIDIEKITGDLDKYAIGPEMAVTITCPKCGKEFKKVIDWSYDDFFGTSSL